MLLLAQVIAEQTMPRNISSVHTRQRVVHQQVHVEVVDPGRLSNSTVGLTEIITPFG